MVATLKSIFAGYHGMVINGSESLAYNITQNKAPANIALMMINKLKELF